MKIKNEAIKNNFEKYEKDNINLVDSGVRPANTCSLEAAGWEICLKPAVATRTWLRPACSSCWSPSCRLWSISVLFKTLAGKAAALLDVFHLPHHL